MQKEWFNDLWCEQFRREALCTRCAGTCGPGAVRTADGVPYQQFTNQAVANMMSWGGRGFIVLGGHRDEVCVRGNVSLNLEYECRSQSGMPGILTDEMKSTWLVKHNQKVEQLLLKDIRADKRNYTPIYGGNAVDSGIVLAEKLYAVYTYMVRHSPCAWEELYGFGLAECRKYKLLSMYAKPPNEKGFCVDMHATCLETRPARYDYAFLPCGPSCMNTRIAWGQVGKVDLTHWG